MKILFFLAVTVLLTGHTVLQAQPSVQNIIKSQTQFSKLRNFKD
jgi:hypothetical protein